MSDHVPYSDVSSTSQSAQSRSGPKPSPVWDVCFNPTGPRKSGRAPHKCKFCDWPCDGRVADAENHIANNCSKVSEENKLAATGRLISKTKRLDIPSLVSRDSKRQRTLTGSAKGIQSLSSTGAIDNYKVSSAQKQTWDMGLLRWITMSGIPFNAVNSPFFVTWVHSMRPNYQVAGATALQTSILAAELVRVKELDKLELQQGQNMSMTLDGWSDAEVDRVLSGM
ncbi:TPA: hypothetical protein ACH3X1_002917 [Trebouxia sp. C0004]